MRKIEARLKALSLGQFLSLLITALGFSSTLLVRQGINVPTLQSFMNYFVLATVYGSYLLIRKKPLKAHWYLYACLALIDVEANYFTIRAYQYTSITSVTLLDCWAIPCVLLLTAVFLHTRYFRGHYIGVVLCVLGLMLVMLSDVHAGDRAGGSNVLLGDFLVLIGSTLYAIANVYEEFMVKKYDRSEILAILGIFGAIITACQVYILERKEVQAIHWTSSVIIPLLTFSASQLLFSSVFLILLQTDGSAMFNLSLLTSDMYAVGIRWLIFHESVDWLYFGAFATVAVGLVVYAYSGEPPDESDGLVLGNIPYERVGTSLVEHTATDLERAPGTCDSSIESTPSQKEKVQSFSIEPSSVAN